MNIDEYTVNKCTKNKAANITYCYYTLSHKIKSDHATYFNFLFFVTF